MSDAVKGSEVAVSDAVELQLRKILNSKVFGRAGRLSRLLRYLVERAMAGEPASAINEHTIAAKVFDKGEDFDPRIEPVVRVQMARLRTRLKAYYEKCGGEDPLIIELPPRSYLPAIRPARANQPGFAPDDQPRTGGIAVVPFRNISSDAENAFFCEGLTDEVIHALGARPGLRVVVCRSGSAGNPVKIGIDYRVQLVLEGGVRKSEDRIRISVQLFRSADGALVWSNIYDRRSEDAFSVQEDIASTIARALRSEQVKTRTAGGGK